jgi:hypothetical protein
MKRFADLYAQLDRTTKTSRKVNALARYFAAAPPQDAAWALYFLSGRRLKRVLPANTLATLAVTTSRVPEWLMGECYEAVGDFAEVIALILPPAAKTDTLPLAQLVTERVLPLKNLAPQEQGALIAQTWDELDDDARLVFHKILTGAFRVGVSELLVLRGLSQACGVDPQILKHRTMGDFTPSAAAFRAIVAPVSAAMSSAASDDPYAIADVTSTHAGASPAGSDDVPERPYPFFLAHPLEQDPASLGARRLADRMVVGRHPLPGGAPQKHRLVVARRRARHRTISGSGGRRPRAARGHRPRRRDPRVEGRCARVLRSAAALEPQEAHVRDARGSPHRVARVRSAGREWRRSARAPAE